MDELEVLQLAGMLEDSGYRFYREAAKHVKNDQVRELVGRLAEEERQHMAVFDALYQELVQDRGNYDDSYFFDEEVERYFRQLVANAVFPEPAAVPKLVKGLKTTEQVLVLAIQAEESSIKYYDRLSRETRFEKTRETANRLIAEEANHKESLERLLGV